MTKGMSIMLTEPLEEMLTMDEKDDKGGMSRMGIEDSEDLEGL